MKKMKKVLSLILTVVMVLAMAAPAMAAITSVEAGEGDFTITIENNTTGHTYQAYQIFDGVLAKDDNGTLENTKDDRFILSDIKWGSGIDSAKVTDLMTALGNETGFSGCTTAAQVAEKLNGEIDDSDLAKKFASIVSVYLSTTKNESTMSGDKYVISNLDAGYYLVKDSNVTGYDAYTRFILEVVKNVTVAPKASVPEVKKYVKENSTGEFGTVADYNIGDEVEFKLEGTLPSTLADYQTYEYIFEDTLAAGLSYKENSVKVYAVVGETKTELELDANGVSYSQITDGKGAHKLTVSFADIKSSLSAKNVNVEEGLKIVVKYSATLNSSAVIGNDGNENSVVLRFFNDPNNSGSVDHYGTTTEDDVFVFTYQLEIDKVDGETKNETTKEYATHLAGAKFKISKSVAGETEGETTKLWATVTDNKITGWTNDENNATEVVTGQDGKLSIIGLDAGTYTLKETAAPTGYNSLSGEITVQITATHTEEKLTALKINTTYAAVESGDKDGNVSTGVVNMTVENFNGTQLPSTGGIGTTIFYLVGILVMAGAVFFVIRSRRHEN